MTAFHCTKRAAGDCTVVGFEYGPNQRDHSLPGSSVFPDRTKNSRRGSPDEAVDFAAGTGGGLHHSMRPHCENNCASNDRDSYAPSASYSGPSENTLPGFAVHRRV